MINLLTNFFFEPRVAFILFLIFIIIYLILLDEEGAFTQKFLNFGPDKNTKFLNMPMDTWEKVYVVYILAFVSSLLTSYYNTVMFDFIHSKLWNPAYNKTINITKGWAQIIIVFEPIFFWILSIIQFFITLTMELQFILPQFFGQIITGIPYGLFKVNQKKYTE